MLWSRIFEAFFDSVCVATQWIRDGSQIDSLENRVHAPFELSSNRARRSSNIPIVVHCTVSTPLH